MKKILSVTGNRADYDLMSYLYRKLNADPEIDLQLVVTGAHLTAGYASSLDEMRRDGCAIAACIENILASDSPASRIKSMSIFLNDFIQVVSRVMPDVILCVGDREEVPAIALVAAYLKIPCVHFFGGDYVADGHVDNLARSTASVLSTVHIVSLEEHKRRLMAMGEEERRIFAIGSIALDKFREEPMVDRDTLMERLGRPGWRDYALVIYHPPTEITGENPEIANILKLLKERGINAFVSYPNTDFNHSGVEKAFAPYLSDDQFRFYRNLDRNTFINLYRHASFQVGNSSAGIAESASIPLPVINVGSRQRSRRAQENVLFVSGGYADIARALDTVESAAFRARVAGLRNLYGDGRSSETAYQILKDTDFRELLLKTHDPLEVQT